MNSQRPFVRKMVYVVTICVLLLPLYLLARPASTDRPGGRLSQLRQEAGLSQAQLGEIDPASETIKLATLGLRGVAANILWAKANDYKKKKDWTNLSATLNQITRLEPNFIAVWRFQAWNLSYNVSAEFDDYRERYRWVIHGIEFLIRGVGYNKNHPRLYWDVGWFAAQKIGRADEHKEFRAMFLEDDDFHEKYKTPSLEDRDNWLVGKRWFARSEDVVKAGGSLGNMSEVVYYAHRPMCQMNYSEGLEEDGIFGEKAKQSWKKAGDEWSRYGAFPIQTSFTDDEGKPLKIFLNERESFASEAAVLRGELDSIEPDLREDILQERWSQLSDKEMGATHYMCTVSDEYGDPTIMAIIALLDKRLPAWRTELLAKREAMLTDAENQLLATPKRNRQEEQHQSVRRIETKLFEVAGRVREKMVVSDRDVARRIAGPDRSKASQLTDRIAKAERMTNTIQNYRQIVNFEHWRRLAKIEQSSAALAARSSIFKGNQALADGLLPEAADRFAEGMAKWRELFDDPGFSNLAADDNIADAVMESIEDYVKVLEQRDALFPDDFPLAEFLVHRAAKQSEGPLRMAREATAAREKALAEGNLETALTECESGLKLWQGLLEEFPALTLMASKTLGQEIFDTINGYGDVLQKRNQPFPDNFPLLNFLHLHIEQAEETLKARNAIAQGNQLLDQSKFPAAQEAYDRGLAEWRKLLDKFPVLLDGADKAVAGELIQAVEGYEKILELRGKEFPENFILRDVRQRMRPAG